MKFNNVIHNLSTSRSYILLTIFLLEFGQARGDLLVVGNFATRSPGFEFQFEIGQCFLDFELGGRAKLVDEQHPVEVVRFMLNNPSDHAVEVDVDLIAGEVIRIQVNFLRTFHLGIESRQTQTALFRFVRSFRLGDDRIDRNELLILLLWVRRWIHDEQPVGQIHLVCRQPDPFGFVHQLEHLFDDLLDVCVDPLQGLGTMPEGGMRVMNDFQ